MRITIVIEGAGTGEEAPSVQVLHSAGAEMAAPGMAAGRQDMDAGPAPGQAAGMTSGMGASAASAPGMAASMAVPAVYPGAVTDAGAASPGPGMQGYPMAAPTMAAPGQTAPGEMQGIDAGTAPRPGDAMPPPSGAPAQTDGEPAAGKSKRKRARKAT